MSSPKFEFLDFSNTNASELEELFHLIKDIGNEISLPLNDDLSVQEPDDEVRDDIDIEESSKPAAIGDDDILPEGIHEEKTTGMSFFIDGGTAEDIDLEETPPFPSSSVGTPTPSETVPSSSIEQEEDQSDESVPLNMYHVSQPSYVNAPPPPMVQPPLNVHNMPSHIYAVPHGYQSQHSTHPGNAPNGMYSLPPGHPSAYPHTVHIENCHVNMSPYGNPQHPGTLYGHPAQPYQGSHIYQPYVMTDQPSMPIPMKSHIEKDYDYKRHDVHNRGNYRGRGGGRARGRKRRDDERSSSVSSDHSSYSDSGTKVHYKDNGPPLMGHNYPMMIRYPTYLPYVGSVSRSPQGYPMMHHPQYFADPYATQQPHVHYQNPQPPAPMTMLSHENSPTNYSVPPPPPPPPLPPTESEPPLPPIAQVSMQDHMNLSVQQHVTSIATHSSYLVDAQQANTSCHYSYTNNENAVIIQTYAQAQSNLTEVTESANIQPSTVISTSGDIVEVPDTCDQCPSQLEELSCNENLDNCESVDSSLPCQNGNFESSQINTVKEITPKKEDIYKQEPTPEIVITNIPNVVPHNSCTTESKSQLINNVNVDDQNVISRNSMISNVVTKDSVDKSITSKVSQPVSQVTPTENVMMPDQLTNGFKSKSVSNVTQSKGRRRSSPPNNESSDKLQNQKPSPSVSFNALNSITVYNKSHLKENKMSVAAENKIKPDSEKQKDQFPKVTDSKPQSTIKVHESPASQIVSKEKVSQSSIPRESNICHSSTKPAKVSISQKGNEDDKTQHQPPKIDNYPLIAQKIESCSPLEDKINPSPVEDKMNTSPLEDKINTTTSPLENNKNTLAKENSSTSTCQSNQAWGQKKIWSQLFNKPNDDFVTKQVAFVTPFNAKESSEDNSEKQASGSLSNGEVSNSIIDEDKIKIGGELKKYKAEYGPSFLQPRGLINKNYWCYVNAPLQALLACPSFYQLTKMLSAEAGKESNNVSTPFINSIVDFSAEFSPMSPVLKSGRKEKGASKKDLEVVPGSPFEPTCVYKMLVNCKENQFTEGRQQDAEEMLSCVLNGLHDEMVESLKLIGGADGLPNPPGDKKDSSGDDGEDEWKVQGPKRKSCITRTTHFNPSPISQIFWGQLRSVLQQGGSTTANLQPFNTLPLDIQSTKVDTLKDALSQLVTKEEISGFTCPKTNQEVTASNQVMLEDLPRVLILQLKRFIYDKDGGLQKVTKKLQFPVDLDLTKDLISVNSRGKFSAAQRKYKLFAVVNHEGKEATKGHYVADVFHSGYGCWLRYDDSNVKSIPESIVLKHDPPRVPYLLFYRRADTLSSSSTNATSANSSNSNGKTVRA